MNEKSQPTGSVSTQLSRGTRVTPSELIGPKGYRLNSSDTAIICGTPTL